MAMLTRLLFSEFNRIYYGIVGGDSQMFLIFRLGVISVYTFYIYTYRLDESSSTALALLSGSHLNNHNSPTPTQPRPYSRFHGIIKQIKKDMKHNMARRRTAPDNAQPIPETLPASFDRCTGLCLRWLAATRIAESKQFSKNALGLWYGTLVLDTSQFLCFLLHLEECSHLLVHGAGSCWKARTSSFRVPLNIFPPPAPDTWYLLSVGCDCHL